MKLIIVNGLPATGKTSLAKNISEKLNITYFSKDEYKEILFDEIGFKTAGEKKKFEIIALKIIYNIFEKFLKSGKDIILEANFYSEFSSKVFNDFREKYNFEIVQIKCVAPGNILFERFIERANSEGRHKGHKDDTEEAHKKWKKYFDDGVWERLHIPGKYMELDTSDFSKINYEEIYKFILEK